MKEKMISESILEGERVRLRPVEERDLPHFVRWLADREVTRWLLNLDEPPTLEEEYDWYERKRGDPGSVLWAIETRERQLLGTVELRLAEGQPRAEMGIAIQDKSQWGRSYGTEAVRLVLGYAFEELALDRVELTTDEENARAIRCYEKCGFRREGLLRRHRLVDGRLGNTVVMAALRDGLAPTPERPRFEAKPLEGEKTRLRPLTAQDVPLLARWLNDPDVRHWLHLSEDSERLLTLEAHRERFERIHADPAHISWCIETKDGQPIGEIGLTDIHQLHFRAELGVTIGEKEYWSRGYGTDAVRRVLRYAFEEMGLRRVGLITDEDNLRGIRCYEKCGFVREGLLRHFRLRHGRPLNMIAMGALRDDFEARARRR